MVGSLGQMTVAKLLSFGTNGIEDKHLDAIKHEFSDSLKKLPGFVQGTFFHSQELNEYCSLVLWESAAHANDASDKLFPVLGARLKEIGGTPNRHDLFDVLANF